LVYELPKICYNAQIIWQPARIVKGGSSQKRNILRSVLTARRRTIRRKLKETFSDKDSFSDRNLLLTDRPLKFYECRPNLHD
jgi:hypothetical protein